ncbi:hypothetical protein [Draconibacterium sp.]
MNFLGAAELSDYMSGVCFFSSGGPESLFSTTFCLSGNPESLF